LDKLKPQINQKYERYEKLAKERSLQRAQNDSQNTPATSRGEWRFAERSRKPSTDPLATQTIAASENRDIAMQLAKAELKRRTMVRKATRRAGIPEEVEQERRTAGVWGNWEEDFTNDTNINMDTLSRQIQNVRLQVDGRKNSWEAEKQAKTKIPTQQSLYNYPTIPLKSEQSTPPIPAKRPELPSLDTFSKPPTPPPKDSITQSPPPKPLKQPLIDKEPLNTQPSSPANEISSAGYSFVPAAYLENGKPLRTIFLNPDLRHRFLAIAESNTRKNLETCGILCGTLISNALFISRLVIPEQQSTSDTCEMLNESALFDYVDGEDLMVLGWIHTHPTQTCFMSSRDLHTHCGYQVMMPESIAIVCAPSKTPE
jgi:STAM-binding protein